MHRCEHGTVRGNYDEVLTIAINNIINLLFNDTINFIMCRILFFIHEKTQTCVWVSSYSDNLNLLALKINSLACSIEDTLLGVPLIKRVISVIFSLSERVFI